MGTRAGEIKGLVGSRGGRVGSGCGEGGREWWGSKG